MLRTGERGVVYGDGERAPPMLLPARGRGFVPFPSIRASTSLRSSSSMASIDMGCCFRAMMDSLLSGSARWRVRGVSGVGVCVRGDMARAVDGLNKSR